MVLPVSKRGSIPPLRSIVKRTEMDTLKRVQIEALEKSLGVVTTACRQSGVARSTHYKWMSEDEDFADAVKDLENVALDFAESKLHKRIEQGDTTATIFYLKTKGKHRGYVERVDLTSNGNQLPAPVIIAPNSKSE